MNVWEWYNMKYICTHLSKTRSSQWLIARVVIALCSRCCFFGVVAAFIIMNCRQLQFRVSALVTTFTDHLIIRLEVYFKVGSSREPNQNGVIIPDELGR